MKSQPFKPTDPASSSLLALSDGLAAAAERASLSLVAVNARPRIASSGVHWRPGVIVSANHTVKQNQDITITTYDGRTLACSLAGRDPGADLAVLRLEQEPAGLPVAEQGDSAALKPGHLVLAVGRTGPGGHSASLGLIGTVGGPWRTGRGGQIDRLLGLNMSIFYGFSGSPLVDVLGRTLGINTSGLSRGGALSVPASTVNRVTDELLQKGRVSQAYLGVGLHPVQLPESVRSRLDPPRDLGLVVLSVEPAGPAERAGLVVGDVLIALDGVPVQDTDDVQSAMSAEKIGRSVPVSLLRGGAPAEITLTVGERP